MDKMINIPREITHWVCPNCGEIFKIAPRCPECGQLIQEGGKE